MHCRSVRALFAAHDRKETRSRYKGKAKFVKLLCDFGGQTSQSRRPQASSEICRPAQRLISRLSSAPLDPVEYVLQLL